MPETDTTNTTAGGDVEPGGLVPPYEGRTTGGDDANQERKESVERQMAQTGGTGSGGTTSPANESPAREEELIDEAPEPALGVGKSISTRGEDVQDRDGKEAGRYDDDEIEGRPRGHSDERDGTGLA